MWTNWFDKKKLRDPKKGSKYSKQIIGGKNTPHGTWRKNAHFPFDLEFFKTNDHLILSAENFVFSLTPNCLLYVASKSHNIRRGNLLTLKWITRQNHTKRFKIKFFQALEKQTKKIISKHLVKNLRNKPWGEGGANFEKKL